MESGKANFGLWYDFRNPDPNRPFERLYAESLEQISWAETLGFDSVWLTEHHFCNDGYTPSPLVLLGAIADRTKKMSLATNLMIAALHDPIRLAEDAASLAVLSGGRFDLGLGMGYRELEFDAFGRNPRNRPSLLEEAVEILRLAFGGESIKFDGRRFKTPDLKISPIPERPPRIFIGAHADSAIERAARIGDGYLSGVTDHFATYLAAMERVGKDPNEGHIYAQQRIFVAEDPEREWAQIGDHALLQVNTYVDWGAFPGMPPFRDRDELLDRGLYEVMDAPAAVRLLKPIVSTPQVKDVHVWAQLPGEPVESGSRRIAYMADQLLPHLH